MLRTNVPDAALVDIALPGSSGLELTASLRQSLPHLPVIVVSAVESVDVAIEALRLGVTDYVTKPFRFREILFRLDRALEMVRRTMPPAATSNAAMPVDLEIPMAEHLQRAQRTYLQRLLARCEGDVAETARRAGVPVGEMDHLMSHLGLVASDHRQTQP